MNRPSAAADPPAASSPRGNTRDRPHPSVRETAPATDALSFPSGAVLPEATPQAATLSDTGRDLVATSLASNTRRAYLGALTRLAAVHFQARLMGRPSPAGPLVERTLRGYVRQGEKVSRRG